MGYILTDTLPAYELVGDITVSSATTSVSFTGLNFTSADDLLLVSDVINNSGSGSNVYLFVNGNTTITNYYHQQNGAYSTTIAPSRLNYPRLLPTNSGERSFSSAKIKLTNSGYFVYQSNVNFRYSGSNVELYNYYNTSTFTETSITTLTVSSAVASAIGVGSRFRLYKLVAEKVADITVSTATTRVDITGLSIDKGSEYMLVSDVNSNNALGGTIYLFANNNTTDINYYNQLVLASNTSIVSSRTNNSSVGYVNNANATLLFTTIKLTNSGNIVFQSFDTRQYKTGNFSSIENYFVTSTFTATSITQLAVTVSSSNGINVGSRFQLYKLR